MRLSALVLTLAMTSICHCKEPSNAEIQNWISELGSTSAKVRLHAQEQIMAHQQASHSWLYMAGFATDAGTARGAKGLLDMLSSDSYRRLIKVHDLATIKRKPLAPLIVQLRSRNGNERKKASQELLQLGRRALPILALARNDSDPRIAAEAEAMMKKVREQRRRSLQAMLPKAKVHLVGIHHVSKIGVPGIAEVHVGRTKEPVILVLTGCYSVLWKVTQSPDAKLVKVILGGLHEQMITPIDVPVESYFRRERRPWKGDPVTLWFSAFEDGKLRSRRTANKIEQVTNKEIYRFYGAVKYPGTPFRIGSR